ncbi:MAG TPA: hypothetical protein ACFE0H_15790 [Elainellaceae cyanobacterium]
MVDSIDDIIRQARQGSVAAIIQVLNEKLAKSGIRARAVLAQGILQLLCEAASHECLEQKMLVARIKQILESIQPRRIRRVRINSRIVQEQQLLWLEEVNRDPENQLLWSEEITLAKPNLIRRIAEEWQVNRSDSSKVSLAKTASARPDRREKQQFWRGTLGGIGLSALVLLLGWFAYERFAPLGTTSQAQITEGSSDSDLMSADSRADEIPDSLATVSQTDPFAQAVWIAEKAAQDGQVAQSSAEWLELASRWQRASDLMAEISPDDSRYVTAQNRQFLYQQNSEAALRQAEALRSPPSSPSPPDN